VENFPETTNWKLIKVETENLSGYDEERIDGTFLRKSDNKEFEMWAHDDGGSTVTLSDKLIEK